MERNIETLEQAIAAMREKIEQQIPTFRAAALAQRVTVGTGEEILRQNPEVAEFRALTKDYAQLIRAQRELADSNIENDTRSLDSIRQKFKVVAK